MGTAFFLPLMMMVMCPSGWVGFTGLVLFLVLPVN